MEYGGFSKINDTVGVLIEFKNGIGMLSFYRNGVSEYRFIICVL